MGSVYRSVPRSDFLDGTARNKECVADFLASSFIFGLLPSSVSVKCSNRERLNRGTRELCKLPGKTLLNL